MTVPTIDLTDDELVALATAVRRAIEDDRFPHAPRLDPLRAALGKFGAATTKQDPHANKSDKLSNLEPTAAPAKADKRVRR